VQSFCCRPISVTGAVRNNAVDEKKTAGAEQGVKSKAFLGWNLEQRKALECLAE